MPGVDIRPVQVDHLAADMVQLPSVISIIIQYIHTVQPFSSWLSTVYIGEPAQTQLNQPRALRTCLVGYGFQFSS
jgi:hypothetical protein